MIQRRPLAGDDDRTRPYQMSQAAWLSIFYAVDHLNAARILVVEAKTIPAVGLFTLVRGALETASRAVYLLAPTGWSDRLLRRVRVEAAEMQHADPNMSSIGQPASSGRQRRRDLEERARELGRQLGIHPDQDVTAVSYAEIIHTAGRESPIGERRATLVWKLCSGYAHGDRWPIPAASDLEDLPGAPEGIRHLRVAAGPTALLLAVWTATQMIEQAWELYDARRRRPFPHLV